MTRPLTVTSGRSAVMICDHRVAAIRKASCWVGVSVLSGKTTSMRNAVSLSMIVTVPIAFAMVALTGVEITTVKASSGS